MLTQALNQEQAQKKQAPTWWQSLKQNVAMAYNGIVNKIKSPFAGLSDYFKQKENKDSVDIKALREKHFNLIAQESKKPNPNYGDVTKLISADTKQFMGQIIQEEMNKLGKPPCEYSVITLGSMARQECGPVTDLEIGFLIKEKTVENYKYFQQLSQNLSDRLFLLGEHPDIGGKGLRMDEADNAPPHKRFFARNLTDEQARELQNDAIKNRDKKKMPNEGSRPFLATYDEFAEYSKPHYAQDKKELDKLRNAAFESEWEKAQKDPKNKTKLKTKAGTAELRKEIGSWVSQMYRPFSNRELNIADSAGKKLGRNMALLYGNEPLFNRFMAKRNNIFAQKDKEGKTGRQNIAKDKMKDDIAEIIQKGKSPYLTGKLDKTLDIKRGLYRFVEQFITNLGFYHQCKSQNCLDILDELKQKQIISPESGAKLNDYVQFITGLRLKEQSILKRQGFEAYLDQEEFDEDRIKLEKEIKQLEESINYMQSVPETTTDAIASKQRALVEMKDKYHHMLEMAPGKIISPSDLEQLKTKYVPMAQEIYSQAQLWTQGKENLGFTNNARPVAQKHIEESVDYVRKHPGGFFPALNLLKQKEKDLSQEQAAAFVKKCEQEKLLTTKDRLMLTFKNLW